MQPLIRKTIGLIIAVTLLLLAYLGSFLPMRKSAAFIRGLRTVEAAAAAGEITPDLFERIMFQPLIAPSPIGQEELVRQATGMVLDVIQQSGGPEGVERLINFAESFYTPIIERGRGTSFSQSLYVLGLMHQTAAVKTRDGRYLAVAQAYFEEGLRRGPDRPQFLYGLLDLYRMTGDFDRAREAGERILALWPSDERVRKALEEL